MFKDSRNIRTRDHRASQEKRPPNLAGLSRFAGAALQSSLQQDLL